MKPHRVRMAHALIMHYGLYKHMEIFRPHLIQENEMTLFHADDYINFLQNVRPVNGLIEDHKSLRPQLQLVPPASTTRV